jgi:hypothetical protein
MGNEQKIDHAAEARTLEQNAWQRGGPLGDELIRTHEQRHDMILSAQVHATLALVEQQRIANLIAYASHRLEHRSALGPAGEDAYPETMMRMLGRADQEIRWELGL